MTSTFRMALSLSVVLHTTLLIGLPTALPPAFDVERAPTSVELVLMPPEPAISAVAQSPTPPAPPEAPAQTAPPQPPAPAPIVSEARRGAEAEVLPGYLRNPPPVYPHRAREQGWEGTVLLEVEVLSSGRCGTVNVLSSSGHAILDQAAVEAVQRWRFRPAKRWSQPVAFWVEIPMTFQLLEGTSSTGR